MTRTDLIAALAARFPSLTPKDAEAAVKIILGALSDSLAAGNRVEIRGFGSLGLRSRKPRIGRNPKSGEKVEVPAKCVPYFKAGLEMRVRVDTVTMTKSKSADKVRAPAPVTGLPDNSPAEPALPQRDTKRRVA